jgi:hypothetical protein
MEEPKISKYRGKQDKLHPIRKYNQTFKASLTQKKSYFNMKWVKIYLILRKSFLKNIKEKAENSKMKTYEISDFKYVFMLNNKRIYLYHMNRFHI